MKVETEGKDPVAVARIESFIHTVRGQKVMLDSDLARLYGVETGALNRAVRRDLGRFPQDFRFQLSDAEMLRLRCQSGISKIGRGGRRYAPFVFTEHGAIMADGLSREGSGCALSAKEDDGTVMLGRDDGDYGDGEKRRMR